MSYGDPRSGHRAIVKAALRWYEGTQQKDLAEVERGRRYATLKAACEAVAKRAEGGR